MLSSRILDWLNSQNLSHEDIGIMVLSMMRTRANVVNKRGIKAQVDFLVNICGYDQEDMQMYLGILP